jgi:hypothetical protein
MICGTLCDRPLTVVAERPNIVTCRRSRPAIALADAAGHRTGDGRHRDRWAVMLSMVSGASRHAVAGSLASHAQRAVVGRGLARPRGLVFGDPSTGPKLLLARVRGPTRGWRDSGGRRSRPALPMPSPAKRSSHGGFPPLVERKCICRRGSCSRPQCKRAINTPEFASAILLEPF